MQNINSGKKFYIRTFGCQMNKSDSVLIIHSLKKQGFIESNSPDEADILIYNTCSVREHAEDRVIGIINSHRPACKRRGAIFVITGCMAQRLGNKLIEDDIADLVIGPYQAPGAGPID